VQYKTSIELTCEIFSPGRTLFALLKAKSVRTEENSHTHIQNILIYISGKIANILLGEQIPQEKVSRASALLVLVYIKISSELTLEGGEDS